MVQNLNLPQIKRLGIMPLLLVVAAFISGCTSNNIIDQNVEIPARRWNYRNHIKATFEIKDHSKPYNIYFKLRHTADYSYANLFILAHFRQGKTVVTRRYQYKLAKNDGEWLGSGSGNLFTYTLPMLTTYYFPQNGEYTIEVEQNMRDNPLLEISDAGILVEQAH